MISDDRNRLNLFQKLEATLGPEEANTLMAHLPPVTWNQLATKSDLELLRASLSAEFRGELKSFDTSLRAEMAVGFANLRTEMIDGVNRQIKWLVTFAAAWTSLLLAAMQFMK